MKLRTVSERNLVQGREEEQSTAIVYSKNDSTQQVKFKKVTVRKKKKIVSEFYGELVYLSGSEDIKVLLPAGETAELGFEIRVQTGDYFLGKLPVRLSNPRKLKYVDVVLFDIEYDF